MKKLSVNKSIPISEVGKEFTVHTEKFTINVKFSNSFGYERSKKIGEHQNKTFKVSDYSEARSIEFATGSDLEKIEVDIKMP